MHDEAPAHPPVSVPEQALLAAGRNRIHEFTKQSVLLLLLFGVITLGIYLLVWVYRQVKVINRLLPQQAISQPFLYAFTALYIGYYLTGVAELIYGETPELWAIEKPLDLAGNIIFLVMVFKIRNRLNIIVRAQPGGAFWLSALLTFFFNIFYIQYKINRLQERIPQFGFCAQCGYDLRGLTEPRCPECGTTFDPVERGVRMAAMLTEADRANPLRNEL